MLKFIKFSTISLALILAACNNPAQDSSASQTDNETLSNAADSLARFLADSYADYAISLMDSVPEEYSQNFSPELFAEGFVSILKPGLQNAGKQYGIIQGALANNRIINIRSNGININSETFLAGFEKGMSNASLQDSTTAILNKLMAPVNQKIILQKRRMHQRPNE